MTDSIYEIVDRDGEVIAKGSKSFVADYLMTTQHYINVLVNTGWEHCDGYTVRKKQVKFVSEKSLYGGANNLNEAVTLDDIYKFSKYVKIGDEMECAVAETGKESKVTHRVRGIVDSIHRNGFVVLTGRARRFYTYSELYFRDGVEEVI